MAEPRLTLIDSSAWIELLRGGSSSAGAALEDLLRRRDAMATTDPIRMELLAGARDDRERAVILGVLARCRSHPVRNPGDWEGAASIFQACRQRGVTPRKLLDCLIAAVAIRVDVPVLAHDRDFELIAQHTELRIAA